MRVTIVGGFFLPVPPVSGGSTEKSWFQLARQFTARGHEVTFLSRRWPGWPDEEKIDGVRHVRLPGFDHRPKLWQNLALDFLWSLRCFAALPRADILVVNAVALPSWVGLLRPSAGRLVLMTGRMPKGQYRRYRRVARVLAASSYVRDRVIDENPGLGPVARVMGYPIDCTTLGQRLPAPPPFLPPAEPGMITLGYVGRIHEEKGLLLLAEALRRIAQTPGLPRYRLLLCGPCDVAQGGSGAAFRSRLLQQLATSLPPDRFHLLNPQFGEAALAAVYQAIDVFCYPSLAEKGETFGVAVAEAMAAGAVPVTSNLACFTDFVRPDENGLVFDHRAADAADALADALTRLLRDAALREKLSATARLTARRYDYATYAETLLTDFEEMCTPRP